MVRFSYSIVEHFARKQLFCKLKFIVTGNFIVKNGTLANDVGFIVELLKCPELIESFENQAVVVLNGSADRIEMDQGFIFVSDYEFIACRKLV